MPEFFDVNAVKKEEVPSGEPEPSSRATAKMVNGLITQANRASKTLRQEWPENYRFVVSGQQWPIKRPRWRFSEVVNITWSNIMTEVGIQTDGRPTVDYVPPEPGDQAFVEALKEVNEINWSKSSITGHGWQRKLATAIFKCKLYHVVHGYVGWNKDLEGGLGDVDFQIFNPYGCFWDPIATCIEEARWFIYAEPVPTAKLKLDFPNLKEFIKPDVHFFGEPANDGISDTDIDLAWRAATMDAGQSTGRKDQDSESYGGEPMTLWVRCWLKDDTVEQFQEVKEMEGGGSEIEYVKKKKFPKGRYIEVCNNVTLKDEENEFEDGHFPIATLVNYDYGEYCGETEVTHQKGPQKIVNYVWSHILDQMKMGSNPQTIVTANASEIVKKLTNEPGLVVQVPKLDDIRREPGVGIAPGMFQILQESLALIDKVGGLQDASRGAPQPGVTSGLMLEGFVEAAQTRPRLKNRSVDEFLKQVGYFMASRYLQFYTAPRVFRMTSKEGWPEFVEFFVKEDEMGQKVASVKRTTQEPGMEPMVEGPVEVPVKGIPDVKVESGSSLPFARAQKTATAKELFTAQAIDREELLTSINWPNAEEVNRRMAEQDQAAAEAQAAEEAAKGGT